MIVCTKESSIMLAKTDFKKDMIAVVSLATLMSNIVVDPTTFPTPHSIYIISDKDIGGNFKAKANQEKFINALKEKHPASRILFICRGLKSPFGNTVPEGINAILIQPSPSELYDKINSIVEDLIEERSAYVKPQEIKEYTPEVEVTEPEPEVIPETAEEPVEVPEPEKPAPMPANSYDSLLAERIRETNTVHNISMVLREMNSDAIIREILAQNSKYSALASRMNEILNNIASIYADDVNYPTLREKSERSQALVHELTTYSGEASTELAEYFTKIMDVLFNAVIDNNQKELDRIQEQVGLWGKNKVGGSGNAHISALTEEQAALDLELENMQQDISNLGYQTDKMIGDLIHEIAIHWGAVLRHRTAQDLDLLKDVNVTEETFKALDCLMKLSTKAPDIYGEVKMKIASMLATFDKIVSLEYDIAQAKQKSLDKLMQHKLDDTVTSDSILRRSVRVFIGGEGAGLHTIGLALTDYRKSQGYTAMLLDLTGDKMPYGIATKEYSDILVDYICDDLLLVSGEAPTTDFEINQLLEVLEKYSKHYRSIHVLLRPEHAELINKLQDFTLSDTVIVKPEKKSLEIGAELLRANLQNKLLAHRVIINQRGAALNSLIQQLGISESEEVQVLSVPFIPEIQDAGVGEYNFTPMIAVRNAFKGVTQYV